MNSNPILHIIVLLLTLTSVKGQHSVSGYLTMDFPDAWERKVYLSTVDFDQKTGKDHTKIIATSTLTQDGFFSFGKEVFAAQDRVYKLHVNPKSAYQKKLLSKSIQNYKLFILSKKDSLFFKKGTALFSEYVTSNKAEKEWQKLKRFEARYDIASKNFDPKQYLLETRGYVKDSLHILLVKLMSIKKLDEQQLLEKDIEANLPYYSGLLKELQSSDLDPATYQYLKNKLTLAHQKKTTHNYKLSIIINGITLGVIGILCFFMIRYRKRSKTNLAHTLSKQETVIKELMMSGKTNKEIANELFISLNTVKTHITNIYSKLNINSRKELLFKK
ncbi:response regulator transcription factor [Aquimarina sp. U1-2]|uniref:helix-turn-helix domain-containing protein n=1 Tax=Aquimarina sp. U1-2 TaxID=2823141 RepID=UPI001AECD2C0|nr:LuxR C-terminal-related transcriptional regulator [Aquimarina sp. U1-2]MBP2832252.1 response regulator transcription factor [Aquimarina sp. U1-2]